MKIPRLSVLIKDVFGEENEITVDDLIKRISRKVEEGLVPYDCDKWFRANGLWICENLGEVLDEMVYQETITIKDDKIILLKR